MFTKRLYILKKAFNFQLQVCLSIWPFKRLQILNGQKQSSGSVFCSFSKCWATKPAKTVLKRFFREKMMLEEIKKKNHQQYLSKLYQYPIFHKTVLFTIFYYSVFSGIWKKLQRFTCSFLGISIFRHNVQNHWLVKHSIWNCFTQWNYFWFLLIDN